MMLNRDQIVEKGLVLGESDALSFRDAGYDLRIGVLIDNTSDGKSEVHNGEFYLKPQGIAAAVSKEIIKLPRDICAHASVKTSLCRKGILAINIGIIDPGWEGPISSVLLNFGKENCRLRNADIFLRLTFHTLAIPSSPSPMSPIDRVTYEDDVRRMLEGRLAESFMDFKRAAEEGSKKFTDNLRGTLIKYVPIAALMLAVMTFLLNFSLMSFVSRAMPWDTMQIRGQALSDAITKQTDALRVENQQLNRRLDQMKSELDRLSKKK
jgi:deoxycytidine triphosphate deaminase